ncbi:hypothetical protein D9613_010913 [Agrocybe pediades]|uniref:Alginate lyase domain-containing protein n=1 Tax=Agrocybe pediades TaxID=84607 RepID=A0A8H4VM16_9AGAR|nr:hypothetical protein D9613_010913 [Agrocybe pediades]
MLISNMRFTLLKIATLSSFISTAVSQTAYANDFVDPDYILAKNFAPSTYQAQLTAVKWARTLAAKGPWSVVNKKATPPSGDIHDYMSWAPYWWPDCSNAGNTTALTPEQIWVTCNYVSRDGKFNPDVRLTVNNVGDFSDMAEAVFYNALAWVFDLRDVVPFDKSTYEKNAVRFIRAWFLDADTKMNPNLDYGQMQRGPDGQVGSHTGVLDLKSFAKVASAILILRKGGSTEWTKDLDDQMVAWSKEYINWLETAKIAIEEREATNNHGSFYFNQLAALKLVVGDTQGAKDVTNAFFDGIYMNQIVASGEQPLEAARTRPYHYRAYNLAAMITNARIAQYADANTNVWKKTTTAGATIKSALDFAMTISAATSDETSYASELYPNIAAAASVYGDADGKYVSFIKAAYPGFMTEPFVLWNQPFAEGEASGLAPTSTGKTVKAAAATGGTKSGSSSSGKDQENGAVGLSTAGPLGFLVSLLVVGFVNL